MGFVKSRASLQARAEEVHEGGEARQPNGCNHFAGNKSVQPFSIHPIPWVLFQYDKLYVDNKCYVWNDLQVSVGFWQK